MKGLDVVIPCLNEAEYIEACILSLLSQKGEAFAVNVYVVDGMSTDGTRALVERLKDADHRVHLIDNPARVTPAALNLGIKAGQAPVVAILGAHAEVAPEWGMRNLAALEAHPDAGCAGGIIENVHENDTARLVSLAMGSPFGVGNARFRTGGKAGYVDTVAFGAYRREVFEQVGYFDERLVRNQDDEFNYRLTIAGFKVWFDPEIKSKYYVRGSYTKLRKQYGQYGYWKVLVNRMHRTVTTWRQLVPLAFSAYLVLGLLAASIFPELMALYASGICIYLVGALWAAWRLKAHAGDVPRLVYVFLILHLSYGFGYAKGVLDFLILRKQPDTRSPNLTR